MTAEFIQPPIDHIEYMRGDKVYNHPVNISLCTSIRKGRLRWYPDNIGRPSIVFEGCDVEWVFNSEEHRDRTYDQIAANKYE